MTVVRRAGDVKKGAARRGARRFPIKVWEKIKRPEGRRIDVHARIQIRTSPINSPRQLSQLREKASVTAAQRKPPTEWPSQPSPARPSGTAGRCPAPRSARLPRAQVQLSLMALYLLPDASFCSFLRISSILTSAAGQPPTARGARARPGGDAAATAARPWAPGRPLRSPCSGPARRLMNHARSMPPPRQARSPARRSARRVRCAPRAAMETAGWGAEAETRGDPRGTGARGKLVADVLGCLAGRALAGLGPRERLVAAGSGRGGASSLPPPPRPIPGGRSWGCSASTRGAPPPPAPGVVAPPAASGGPGSLVLGRPWCQARALPVNRLILPNHVLHTISRVRVCVSW